MAQRSDINYDFNNSKSLRIYPKKVRQPLSSIPLSSPLRVVRTALNASEKELKHIMGVANRRLEKVEALIMESVKDGHHLVDEIFIPEYLGFTCVIPENADEIRIYSKEGYNMTRIDDHKWLMYLPEKEKILITMKNMYEAIMILSGIGMDLNVTSYMAGEYRKEKPIEEVLHDVLLRIVGERKKSLDSAVHGKL